MLDNELAAVGDGERKAVLQLSPFLAHSPRTEADTLAIVLLSRDNLQPVYLRESDGAHDGYAEGVVLNTRFGSFPHSTLVNVPWGSQVRASKVDTGSRGRKRKRADVDDSQFENGTPKAAGAGERGTPWKGESKRVAKEAVVASSGFVHVLPPTPEIWTMSLPHRTQVVYTPDYSYILQRIRARPGSRVIEAGAGSGSFTHAAARAVYNGYPTGREGETKGKVFSFEYHSERFEKMTAELKAHKLEGVVKLTYRDVYRDGFHVDGTSPEAEAIFLDLPAPWRALPHLSRRKNKEIQDISSSPPDSNSNVVEWTSPLNPKKSAYLCTFSPCIEQVTRTVSAMRRLGWIDIETVEIANRKIHTHREKMGMGFPRSPRDVTEAVKRLKDVEEKNREHNKKMGEGRTSSAMETDQDEAGGAEEAVGGDATTDGFGDEQSSAKPWVEGQLLARTEPELKTHTSYLVFATLPREWSDEAEAAALSRWPCGGEKGVIGSLDRAARKEQKRQLLQQSSKANRKEAKKDGPASEVL